MLVSSRIQKSICIFNKISLFLLHKVDPFWHLKEEKKFENFFGFFCQFTIVKLAQIQKNQYVLKTSKSCRFGIITIVLIERFLAILLRFSKKKWLKKKIFFQNFFFEFLEIPFSDHNSARFDEKIFFENFKKKFWKKKLFFQMQNVLFLVTEIMKFCWKCKFFFVFLKIQACILILFSFFYHFLRFKICNFEFGHRVSATYWISFQY